LPIATERLILRRFTYDDVQSILDFVSHPSVARIVTEIEATESGVEKYIDMQNSYRLFEKDKCFAIIKGTLKLKCFISMGSFSALFYNQNLYCIDFRVFMIFTLSESHLNIHKQPYKGL